jgi:formate--tetrahydrofolate ligase
VQRCRHIYVGLRGAPEGPVFNVRDVYLSAGAGFMVVLSGDMMTMPGFGRFPRRT